METVSIETASRESGKRDARAARRAGQTPCVVYGGGGEATSFTMSEMRLSKLASTGDAVVADLSVNGTTVKAVLKKVDFHPVTDRPMHADWQELAPGSKVKLRVPIRYKGTPKGQLIGGKTKKVMHEINIVAEAEHVPAHIAVEITRLNVGETIYVENLAREGVTFMAPPRAKVVMVSRPKAGRS